MWGRLSTYICIVLLSIAFVSASPRLTNVDIGPDVLEEGGFLTIGYDLYDSDTLGLVTTDITFGDDMKYRTSEPVYNKNYRFFKTYPIPADYSGMHEFTLRVETEDSFPIIYEHRFAVDESTRAAQYPRTTQDIPQYIIRPVSSTTRDRVESFGADNFAIFVDPEVPNVARGEWIYWPITLVNYEDQPVTVTLGVEGVRDWGSYRIDPVPTVTIPANGDGMVYLYMSVDEDAWLGLRYFKITAEHNGVTEVREVSLAVLEEADRVSFAWLPWVLILLAIIIIIVGAALLLRRKATEEGDDDLITYY